MIVQMHNYKKKFILQWVCKDSPPSLHHPLQPTHWDCGRDQQQGRGAGSGFWQQLKQPQQEKNKVYNFNGNSTVERLAEEKKDCIIKFIYLV